LERASKIRFTKHANEKFAILKRYGFEIKKKDVVEAILQPVRLDERGSQFLASKVISRKHALRVVYESRKGF
jgi:hypothetical protein